MTPPAVRVHCRDTATRASTKSSPAIRSPAISRALQNTMAQIALRASDERSDALRDTMTELLSMDEPRQRFAAMMSCLDIHYDSVRDTPCSDVACPIWTS